MNTFQILEAIEMAEAKTLKKVDVKSTERKMEKDVIDSIDNNEIKFLNNFLRKGEKFDNKNIKSLDVLIAKYKKKLGTGKVNSDPNLMMLAPIIASMFAELEK
jgi:hypothetical protein